MSDSRARLQLWLEEALRKQAGWLTEDEEDYLRTVQLYLVRNGTLSAEQVEVLEHIRKRMEKRRR